jgi:ABC-type multidrug transport system ATPase subunit
MKIKLSNAGKRYNREWIFRKADLEFDSTNSYAITGPNGSGKSTLLQCIGGMLELSEGEMEYHLNGQFLPKENAFSQVSFSAPYMELIEEMSLKEFFSFHAQFKPLLPGFTIEKIISELALENAADKQIRYYSSGMKQRVKLGQSVFFQSAIVLFDEPCSNLDAKGIELYHALVKNYCNLRLVIVCSNDEVEYSFCNVVIKMSDIKPVTHLR